MKYLNQGIWAIGGTYTFSNKYPGSPETFDHFDWKKKVWTKYKTPIKFAEHCLTKISHDKLIIIGGQENGDVSK